MRAAGCGTNTAPAGLQAAARKLEEAGEGSGASLARAAKSSAVSAGGGELQVRYSGRTRQLHCSAGSV